MQGYHFAEAKPMNRSLDRFLTTHTGSLPRPDDLIRMMFAREEGIPVDRAALAARIRGAVAEVVRKQLDAGIAVPSDGEVSKPSYATYVKDRLDGFGGDEPIAHVPGPGGLPGDGQARVRRPRPLAPEDAGLHRPHQRARSRGGAGRRR